MSYKGVSCISIKVLSKDPHAGLWSSSLLGTVYSDAPAWNNQSQKKYPRERSVLLMLSSLTK